MNKTDHFLCVSYDLCMVRYQYQNPKCALQNLFVSTIVPKQFFLLCPLIVIDIAPHGHARPVMSNRLVQLTTSQRSSSNFLVGKKVPPLQTQHHNLSNNYTEMEHCNDGNFLIAQQISNALQTKIAWGLITPWQSGVPF